MTIDEKTRLDLRQKLEDILGPRLADAAMEAMPPLDYDKFATKTDVENLGIVLRGELAELRGDMAKLEGNIRTDMVHQFRTLIFTQLATAMALAGFVAGLG